MMRRVPLKNATPTGWCKSKEFGCECGLPDTEPCPLPQPKDRRVVCAALRSKDGRIIAGPRHLDQTMHEQIRAHALPNAWKTAEQGFLDQRGEFLTREEAWTVAFDAGQIRRRCGGDGKKLFSENLY